MSDSCKGLHHPAGSLLSPDGSLLCQKGWLLPEERAVEPWRGGQRGIAKRLESATGLDDGEPAAGMRLELEEIRAV